MLPPQPRLPQRARWILATGSALGGLFLLWVAGHLAVNRAPIAPLLEAEARRAISQRFAGAELTGHLSVGWFGAISVGGFRLPGTSPDDPPVLAAERVVVHPSYWALLRGKLHPRALELRWVRLQTGPHAAWLKALRKRLTERRATTTTEAGVREDLPEVRVRDLFIDLPQSTSPLDSAPVASSIGPLEVVAHWQRDNAALVFDLQGSLLDGRGGQFTLSGSQAASHGDLTFQGTLTNLALRALPPELFARGDASLDEGAFSGEVAGTLSGKRLTAHGALELAGTSLRWPRLSDEPVGPFDLGARGEITADLGLRTLALHQVHLSANKAEALLDASLGEGREFQVEARLSRLDMQTAIDSLPSALRPPERAPRVEGPLSGDLEVRGVLGKWDTLEIQRADLDLSGLKEAARQSDASSFLAHPFEFTPGNQEPPERSLEIGPGNPHFTPLGSLPAWVPRAVVLSEDAGFYGHHGFDFDEIKESISRDLAKGGAVRGGSTLTQQLVKNLFLSREKKLTRKIQEALITLEVEATLPKSRILELYLNSIEWGPRLYGIGEASERYFGERPQDLSPKQAAFLATLIPNPKKYYWYYSRGALTPAWEDHVGHVLDKLAEVGAIDAAQRAAAVAPLEFHRVGAPPLPEAEPAPTDSDSAGDSSNDSLEEGDKP